MPKQLIVTADDYGVFPAINNGVLEAVRQRKLNSVSVLSNFDGHDHYPGSLTNLRNLVSIAGDDVEIGCHLTITSGRPITDKVDFACDRDGNFLSYKEMRNYKTPEELAALETELCEQVKRMEELPGFKVMHLTNHHNSLTLFPHHFNLYMKVARKFGVPVRSAFVKPEDRQNFYIQYLGLMLRDDIDASDRREMKDFAKKICTYFSENCADVKSPKVLDSRHYGPIPMRKVRKLLESTLIRKKKNSLDSLYEWYSTSDENSLELLLHLAKSDTFQVDTSEDLKYEGVDRSYFDSRALELKSILDYDLGAWTGVDIKSWKHL